MNQPLMRHARSNINMQAQPDAPAEMGLRRIRQPSASSTGEEVTHSREWGSEVWYSPQTQDAKWIPRLNPEAARRCAWLLSRFLWPAHSTRPESGLQKVLARCLYHCRGTVTRTL